MFYLIVKLKFCFYLNVEKSSSYNTLWPPVRVVSFILPVVMQEENSQMLHWTESPNIIFVDVKLEGAGVSGIYEVCFIFYK